MKAVFLDIDGVLATWGSMTQRPRGPDHEARFVPECVARLNRITGATGAEIVVSSSWRQCNHDMWQRFIQYLGAEGVEATVAGRTPSLTSKDIGDCDAWDWIRGLEIIVWLRDHPVEAVVIIDDDRDMGPLNRWFVYVDHGMDHGLLDEHVDRAIEILTSPQEPQKIWALVDRPGDRINIRGPK